MYSLLPATMKSMSAIFNDIHDARDHRAPKPRVSIFLSQDILELSASMSFLRSAHAVNDTWEHFTSLFVSSCNNNNNRHL